MGGRRVPPALGLGGFPPWSAGPGALGPAWRKLVAVQNDSLHGWEATRDRGGVQAPLCLLRTPPQDLRTPITFPFKGSPFLVPPW